MTAAPYFSVFTGELGANRRLLVTVALAPDHSVKWACAAFDYGDGRWSEPFTLSHVPDGVTA